MKRNKDYTSEAVKECNPGEFDAMMQFYRFI